METSTLGAEANPHFSKTFRNITEELAFDKNWSDGVGHFDHAVYGEYAPKLGNGQMVKSMSPGGRRLIMIGTRLGNLIIYDRFSFQGPGEKNYDKAVICRNTTTVLENGGWFCEPVFDDFEIEIALGTENEGNLGRRIEQMWQYMKKAAARQEEQEVAIG